MSELNNQNKYRIQKQKVKDLLTETNHLMLEKDNIKLNLKEVSKEMLEQRIKDSQFLLVTNEIEKLKEQKPEFIKQFYEVQKVMDESLCETEMASKLDYDLSRLDTTLWRMIEKERKKVRHQKFFNKKSTNL